MATNTKVIIGNEIKEATPEIVATLFAEMNNEDQARFFNHVGKVASTWNWGDMSMQLQWVTEDDGLNLTGRRVMQQIGEYSHWGLSCRLERETRKEQSDV